MSVAGLVVEDGCDVQQACVGRLVRVLLRVDDDGCGVLVWSAACRVPDVTGAHYAVFVVLSRGQLVCRAEGVEEAVERSGRLFVNARLLCE